MNSKGSSLTPRQRDVLLSAATLQTDGTTVTIALLSQALAIPRQNIRTYLRALEEMKLVHYIASERRTAIIHVTDAAYTLLGLTPQILALPIVGEVAAGQPGYAQEHVEGYATQLRDVLDIREGDFLLRVRGESMLGIGIYPGDLVVIRPMSEEPNPGEITLVAVPGEDTATLKRWSRNNGTVTLLSENPAYAPMIFPTQDVMVQGCLVGHIGTGRSRQTRFTTP